MIHERSSWLVAAAVTALAWPSGGAEAPFITFAVNAHDWRFVDESADTVLRLVELFERHGVRGDFYLTAPLVERYAEKRPDAIRRLKESRMTISYHVRPPHPLWRGFSGPVEGAIGSELARILRDYERYQLDLRTGRLNRDRPGGYRYVAEMMGRAPCAVGASDASPELQAAARRVYAELGARLAVVYHEGGTRRDRPFEYHDGLLARPSDISVARCPVPGRPEGVFWWNMIGTPAAAAFDPVARLDQQVAEWSGVRPPFITALIHENDFYREGGPPWTAVYLEGQGSRARPRRPPFDVEAPPADRARPAKVREAVFQAYERLVARAAESMRVVTSEDIAAMAAAERVRGGRSDTETDRRPSRASDLLRRPTRQPDLRSDADREAGAPMVRPDADGVFVRVASTAAGAEGVAASVMLPSRARFAEGAPVVVHVAGGVSSGRARGRSEYVGFGLVEIRFAFPGGGVGDERSGGTYDFRGPACIRVLADILRFATGRAPDQDGRFLCDIAGRIKVLTNNVGLVGSSHGGNTAVMALALHGAEFPDIAWYASMESPFGQGAANIELGTRDSGVNPAWDPATGRLDLSRLAWSPDLPAAPPRDGDEAARGLRGALYFDIDQDGRFSSSKDFWVRCHFGDAGGGLRVWYSPRLLAEAERRGLLPHPRPPHVPTLAESQEFWRYRDATPSVPAAVRNCPNLAVIVYAGERDHIQADPSHSHILAQVEGFRAAGPRFVRLNPDRAYVERLAPTGPLFRGSRAFSDNPADATWSRVNIAQGLEPADRAGDGLYAGRRLRTGRPNQAGEWAADLAAVLYPGAPSAPAFPPRRGRAP